jgi:hypothetical protein
VDADAGDCCCCCCWVLGAFRGEERRDDERTGGCARSRDACAARRRPSGDEHLTMKQMQDVVGLEEVEGKGEGAVGRLFCWCVRG